MRMQRIQDNVQMMHTYFEALFSKDLSVILDMIDDNIEWVIVSTGDTLKGKEQIAKLAPNHWAASPNRVKTLVNVFAVSPGLAHDIQGTIAQARRLWKAIDRPMTR